MKRRNSPTEGTTPLLEDDDKQEAQSGCSSMLREGSVQGSCFNLCSATLGAGALSLPYAFHLCGWALGLAFLIVGALATVYSIHLLIRARNATGCTSYEELTVHLFGRGMGFLVELNIFIFCFGTAIAYIIAVGDVLEPVLEMSGLGRLTQTDLATSSGVVAPLNADQQKMLRVGSMVSFFAVIMFPLSLLERINSLRFTSLFGVLSIVYLVAVAVYCSVAELQTVGWQKSWGEAQSVVPDGMRMITAAPIIMFAFTCQVNVFSIYDELERASPRRMGKVTNYAILICFMVYMLMGVFAYLHFGEDTQGNVLQNYFPTRDPMVIMAFAAITFTIVMAFPLLVFPCRYTIEVMLFRHSEPSKWRHFMLTSTICGAALAISLFVRKIQVVFQLMGGTTSAFVCFILPAAFAILLDKQSRLDVCMWERVAMWSLAVGGATVGVLSTAITLYGVVTGTGGN